MSKANINKLLGLCAVILLVMGMVIYNHTPDVSVSYIKLEVTGKYKSKSGEDSNFSYYVRGNSSLNKEQEIKVSKKAYKEINYKDTIDCSIFSLEGISYVKVGKYTLDNISISSIKSSTVLNTSI